MIHIHASYANYVLFGVFALMLVLFHCYKWDFISKALCEGDSPSSKRLGGYILVLVIGFCEVYHTLRTQDFEYRHLIALLVTVILCWGIATSAQIISVYKGNTGSATNNCATNAQPQVAPLPEQELAATPA